MQAIIFVGIQASGKSTFFKEKFFESHLRINLDLLRTRHRERIFLNACLQSGQKFVVDNTNPTAEDRKRYILPAKAANFEIVGYYFESKIAAALERNQQRPEKQRIPIKGLWSTYHKLQLPALTEGLALIADQVGEEVAGKVQLAAEYYPHHLKYGQAHRLPGAPAYLKASPQEEL